MPHPHLLSILLMTTALLSAPHQIECKSYFSLGACESGGKLLLRDMLENRHTGLTEEPFIAFNYVIRERITCIEIESDQNVQADVNLSYFSSFINGTVKALSTTLDDENKTFAILISIYGNEANPSELTALEEQMYRGELKPILESNEVDHMEMLIPHEIEKMETVPYIDGIKDVGEEEEEEAEEEEEGQETDNHEKIDYDILDDADDEDEKEDENYSSEADTFESTDKIMTVGDRQIGDELIYETYQTSHAATKKPTSHNVTFYFIDDVNITHIQFVIIDYFNNKSSEDLKDLSKLKLIEYSHYTSSTFKAIIRDYKTTSLFAKMSVYGYRPENLPHTYVSYIPEKVRPVTHAPITTESPEMYLRERINALQRDDLPRLPSSFNMLRREGDFQYTITTNAGENMPLGNAAAGMSAQQTQIMKLSVMVPLGVVIIGVCRLWSLTVD